MFAGLCEYRLSSLGYSLNTSFSDTVTTKTSASDSYYSPGHAASWKVEVQAGVMVVRHEGLLQLLKDYCQRSLLVSTGQCIVRRY